MATLMENINLVVTEKHEFAEENESFEIVLFWKFRTIKSLMQGSETPIFQLTARVKLWIFRTSLLK